MLKVQSEGTTGEINKEIRKKGTCGDYLLVGPIYVM